MAEELIILLVFLVILAIIFVIAGKRAPFWTSLFYFILGSAFVLRFFVLNLSPLADWRDIDLLRVIGGIIAAMVAAAGAEGIWGKKGK